MKFGKTIDRNSIPEWRSLYIDYHLLKSYIKRISLETGGVMPVPMDHPSVEEFKRRVMMELRKVNEFFTQKETDALKRFDDLERQGQLLASEDSGGRRKNKSTNPREQEIPVVDFGRPNALMTEDLDTLNPHTSTNTLLEPASLASDNDNLTEGASVHPTLESEDSKSVHGLPASQHNPMVTSFVEKVMRQISTRKVREIHGGVVNLEGNEKAAKLLESAYMEYYRFLILLKNYSVLNYTGFLKILKKADKRTGLPLKRTILDIVEKEHFHTSQNVNQLLDSTESSFAALFRGGNIIQAKRVLRIPDTANKTHHQNSFVTGLFLGVILALGIVTFLQAEIASSNGIVFPRGKSVYTIYTGLGLPLLFFWVLGIDKIIWTRFHIHYEFIFEFDPRHTKTYHQFFKIISGLSLMWIVSVSIYVASVTGALPLPSYLTLRPDLQPLVLAGIFLFILFFPFNFFFRSGRLWVLNVLWRIASAPLYPVKFKDFFFADQVNSLVLFMVSFQFGVCYYSYDAWRPESQSYCWQLNTILSPFISFLPSWWRLLQCYRRFRDSKYRDKVHVHNGIKYSLSCLVTVFSGLDSNVPSAFVGSISAFRMLWFVTSGFAASYALYWDLTHDWGVLVKKKPIASSPSMAFSVDKKSSGARKPSSEFSIFGWTIRPRRMYVRVWVYWVAIAVNTAFRFLWPLTKSVNQIGSVFQNWQLIGVLGCIELLRRAQWNLFRMENEHLSNCGKFRAVQDIPLIVVPRS